METPKMKNIEEKMDRKSLAINQRFMSGRIKSWMSMFLLAGSVFVFFCAGAFGGNDNITFLPVPQIISTVPSNGDLNPYGVAFVPKNFSSGGGPLRPGDI